MSNQLLRQALALAFAVPALAHAQGTGSGNQLVHVVYQQWTPAQGLGTDSVLITGVSQTAIPLAFHFGGNGRVTLDVSGGAAMSKVRVKQGNAAERTLDLNGITDLRALVTATAFNDHVAVLAGGTLPTGATSLAPSQLLALGAIAAPAARSPVPVFGGGGSGTAGLTATQQIGDWSLSAGGGYERRFRFVPFSELIAGTPVDATIAPGSVLTGTAQLDGDIAGTGVTLDASVRQFYADTFALKQGTRLSRSVYRLGPLTNVALRIRPTTTTARDLLITLGLQRRAPYEVLGRGEIAGSDASLLSATLSGTVVRRAGWRLGAGLETRTYSGIKSDSSLVAAAFNDVTGSLNIAIPAGGSEFVFTTAASTGSVMVRNKPSVGMRRFVVRGQVFLF
jgi:hypothetical protein